LPEIGCASCCELGACFASIIILNFNKRHIKNYMTEQLLQEIENYKERRNMKNLLEIRWLFMFFFLVDFSDKHGDCNVPARYEENKPLGYWVRKQRITYSDGKSDPLRIQLLKLIGFNFRLNEYHDWDTMFQKLQQIKKQSGFDHISLTQSDSQLYHWLKYQRYLYWDGKLEPKKANGLLKLGVQMENINHWDSKIGQLVEFKNKHGHLHVCRTFTNDVQLMNFVKVIRRNKDSISIERRNELDKIGFIWNPGRELTKILNQERGDEAWLMRYNEYKDYIKQFGTGIILVKSKTHPILGGWVSVQRNNIDNLSPDRIKLLRDIGFFEYNKPKKRHKFCTVKYCVNDSL